MGVTKRLAEFVACTPPEAITAEARTQARRAILDTLGVMLAGCREEASRIVAQMVREQAGVTEASVLGRGFRAPAAEAALVNGTSAHALDYDDVTVNMRGHPSAPLLPAVLALGEKLGASGRQVIEAFVLGFEVQSKVGRAVGAPHYALGWHATSTLGALGAAAACARLLRLDALRTQAAIGIAASLASGLRQNFGTMTKPLHAGWAARNGVVAVSLAERGFSADAEALEGESGFLRAASGGAGIDPDEAVTGLGDPWEIVSPGVGVKLYPCCYATHRAIDAALELREEHRLAAASVSRVKVTVSTGALMPLLTRPPATGLEAKFSLGYCVAAALLDGRVGLASFTDATVGRPEAQRLASRVEALEDGPPADFPIGGKAEVEVWTDGGSRYSRCVQMPRGDPQRPLTWDELAAKFRDCASGTLSAEATEKAIATIGALDEIADVRQLTALLAGA